MITDTETCDGELLDGYTCATLDPVEWSTFGSLSCAPGCQDFDTSACCGHHGTMRCSDNMLYWFDLCNNQEELADDCLGVGCDAATNDCFPPPTCPNGVINAPDEECDGTNLGGQSCESLGEGFTGGTLTCAGNCMFDTPLCCTPDCANKCGGVADGCGGVGTCTSPCGADSVCSAGTCVSCGGVAEPCCDGNTCKGGGTYCSGGSCVSCAANYCQTNGHASGTYCDNAQTITCTTDGNGCYVATAQTCGAGTYCSGGACVSCPVGFCQSNSHSSGTYCYSGSPVTCSTDNNGCYASTDGASCGAGTYCAAGACVACPGGWCQSNDHGSGSYCDSGNVFNCSTDANGCYVTEGQVCGAGTYCSGGSCQSCPAGYCQSNGYSSGSFCDNGTPVTCTTDTNGCYATSTGAACGSGSYCQNGSCLSCPGGWCQSNDHGSGSYCEGSGAYSCSTDANGCYITSGQTCGTGTYCSSGSCVSCSPGWCQVNNLPSGQYCDGNTAVTCSTDANGCYATSSSSCTVGTSYCSNGSCVSCSSNWCQDNQHGSGSYCASSTEYVCSTDSNGCYTTQSGSTNCCTDSDCNSHGTCATGTCNCNTGYDGATCNACAPGYSPYPTCTPLCTVGPPTNINPGKSSQRPSIVYNGSGYGVAYYDYRSGTGHVYFERLDASGKPIAGSEVDLGAGWQPDVAWDAGYSRYGVVWASGAQVYIGFLSSTGTVVLKQQVTTGGNAGNTFPRIAGSDLGSFGVTWNDYSTGTHRTYFARYDANSCTQLGSTATVSSGYGMDPDIVYGPSGPTPSVTWGVGWYNGTAIEFARLGASGTLVGADVTFPTSDSAVFPRVAWNGNKSEFGVIWTDRDNAAQLYFARVKNTGVQVGTTTTLASYTSGSLGEHAIVRANDTYGVAFNNPQGSAIQFVRIDYTGAQLSPILNGGSGYAPDVASNGTVFTVAWRNTDPYTAQITCP